MKSKFVLTLTPPLPAKCAGCGNDAKGDKQFIDMNLSLDYYGAVVFCYDCAAEISRVLGFVSAKEIEEMDDDLARTMAMNVELKMKNEALESVVFAYRAGDSTVTDQLSLDLSSSEDEEPGIRNIEDTELRFT